ncbi:MAG TPA: AEC family transporter [Opitutaceae bacterium]
MTIAGLFILILPVFALIAVGAGLRRGHVVEGTAETSIIRLVVYLCMPCLAFDTIVGNDSLRVPGNLFLPPLAGFVVTCVGIGVSYVAARMIGLGKGTGLRTFAISAGICNYSYLPFPIVGSLWGQQTQGLLLVHNVGVDLALWSVGIIVLTGSSLSSGWKRLISPMFVTILGAVAINVLGLAPMVPGFLRSMVHSLAVCAVPLGLVMTGVNLANYLDEPAKLLHRNVALGACLVRLGVLPVLMLLFAWVLPCSEELKRVLVVQAAMPAAVLPIIVAQYYGGQPLTAVQVVLSTTAAGLVTCPLWIRAGLAWLGIS